MPLLHSRGTYSSGHGAERRAERRKFAREKASTSAMARIAEAGALAKARMSERERAEIGATRRERIAEAGRMSRGVATEAGRETRHLRESALRYRGQRLTATTAAGRLSEVIKGREKKEGLKLYEAEAESLMTPFGEMDAEGEATIPDQLREIYLKGKVEAIRDPKKGLSFLRKSIADYEKDIEDKEWLDSLSEMSLSELKRLREQSTFYPITREGRLSEAR